MTTLPEVVRQSELLNQLVLNRSTLEEWGRIEVLWMYPPSHRVLGFVCKAGFLGRKKLAFKLSQVEAMGANGILTHSPPDETDADRVSQLESLVQSEVWSNAGHKLGKIVDCVFNLRTGAITDYLVVGDRLSLLTGSIYRLPPHQIVSLGRERVLVSATTLSGLTAYREGLQQKIAKVSSSLKDEYEDVTDELRSLAKRAQVTTQQTTGQLKTLAEQARERAQLLAEQARERAQELNEQWLESAQHLAEQARETTETLVERVQDTTQEWVEPLREPPTVTVPAEAIAEEDDWEDWDDDLAADDMLSDPPVRPAPPPRRTSTPNAQPLTPNPQPPPPAGEEDFWVIGPDLTLQRRPAIAQDQEPFTIDDTWNLEDDPWDITEPPTETTTLLMDQPEAEDDMELDVQFVDHSEVPDPQKSASPVANLDEEPLAAEHPPTGDRPPAAPPRTIPSEPTTGDEPWI